MNHQNPDAFKLPPLPLYEQIRADQQLAGYIVLSDQSLAAIGFTEHGLRHAMKVGYWAATVLHQLVRPVEEVELAYIAGYLHDIGNFICRENHGQSGALLLHQLLPRFGLTQLQLGTVMSAVGNHEEQYGTVYNAVCGAVMIADKSDVHRTRVREYDKAKKDIHDDVNYAVTQSGLEIDAAAKVVRLELAIDTSISSVMDYFGIFFSRMMMCRAAAEFLGCKFQIVANGALIS
jgi:metal-dependent HD superfamily phosphatase/phosphodiesterase